MSFQQIISAVVGGMRGPRGFASGPLGANSVGAEELVSEPTAFGALLRKLGIAGSQVILMADLEIAEFRPRLGDSFVLNGHTLTIDKMSDTRMAGLFQGAGQVVIKSGLARPSWWATPSYKAAAIALHLGGGGTVLFDAVRYPSETTTAAPLAVNNVRFQGAGQPIYVAGFSTLAGGTILEGAVEFASNDGNGNALGNNVTFCNLGIDSGSTVCAAANADLEGLTFSNLGQVADGTIPLRTNIVVENVTILCRAATSPVHCLLIEQAIRPVVRNVTTVYGQNGVVLKTRYGLVDGLYARGHGTNCFIDKSDVYAISLYNTWRNIRMGSITGRDTFGGRVQANSSSAAGHVFDSISGGTITALISLEPISNNTITDISMSNMTVDDTRYYGITMGGAISRVAISNLRVNNVVDVADGTYANALLIGSGVDTVTVTGFQSVNTAGDGIRSSGTNVVVSSAVAINPGSGRYGFNAPAGSMKVVGSIGTTNGAVTAS